MNKSLSTATLVLLLSVGCAAHKPIAPPAATLAPSNEVRITVHTCSPAEDTPECEAKRNQWMRKKMIADLYPLMMDDFKNTTEINRAERDREAAIFKYLAEHKYD